MFIKKNNHNDRGPLQTLKTVCQAEWHILKHKIIWPFLWQGC